MNSDSNFTNLFTEVERRIFKGLSLDVFERVVYWHLLLHTHVEGRQTVVYGLDPLAEATAMSTTKLRETLRSIAQKGCVAIDDRSRLGHTIRVFLPQEIEALPQETLPPAPIDLESLDFYSGRQFIDALTRREQGRCFYCLAAAATSTAVLDHCVAQMNGGDNSYCNVVVSCHACNARKQAVPPDDFLRMLYRDGVLSALDLKNRIDALAELQAGKSVPTL
jgi:hypothetical protein